MQYEHRKRSITAEDAQKRHEELEVLREAFEVRRSKLPKKPLKKKRQAAIASGQETATHPSDAIAAAPSSESSLLEMVLHGGSIAGSNQSSLGGQSPQVATNSSISEGLYRILSGVNQRNSNSLANASSALGNIHRLLAVQNQQPVVNSDPDLSNRLATIQDLLGATSPRVTAAVGTDDRRVSHAIQTLLARQNAPLMASSGAPASLTTEMATEAILGSARPQVPRLSVSDLAAALMQPSVSAESTLVASLIGTQPNGSLSASSVATELLAANAIKRSLENTRLYSVLNRDSANSNMLLHEQIHQRQRIQEALGAETSSGQQPDPEGPVNKKPRAA